MPEAAVEHGWGAFLPASDDFRTYSGAPNPDKWNVYGRGGTTGGEECWVGHNGNGRRCVANATVSGGFMRITGEAGGDTTGISHKFGQQYGRWEVRARMSGSGAGEPYHAVLIIWPDSNSRSQDGEYDFLEVDVGDPTAGAWMHYPEDPLPDPPIEQIGFTLPGTLDLTQWHNYAFEWTSTYVKGFIDGAEWFVTSGGGGPNGRRDIQTMPSGHLTIQLDNFTGAGGLQPGVFDVEWARVYTLTPTGDPGDPNDPDDPGNPGTPGTEDPQQPSVPVTPLDPILTPVTPLAEFLDGVLVDGPALTEAAQNLSDVYFYAQAGFRTRKPMTRARLTNTSRSVPNNTDTLITWDVEDWDTDGMLTVPGTTIVVPRTGVYRVGMQCPVQPLGSGSVGTLLGWITRNSTSRAQAIATGHAAFTPDWASGVTVGTGPIALTAGDVLRAYVRQNTGVTATIWTLYGTGRFWCTWIST